MYQQDNYVYEADAGPFFVMLLVVVGSAIAVYIDAKRIGARKGLVTGIANNSAGVWAFGVIALWILVLPVYLFSRSKIRAAAEAERYGQRRGTYGGPQPQAWSYSSPSTGFTPAATPGVGPVLPPAGWYEDPEHRGYNRWWDGHRWTEHRTPKPY